MAEFLSSSRRFLSTVVNLTMAALIAEKKAISLRSGAASSRVLQRVKATSSLTTTENDRHRDSRAGNDRFAVAKPRVELDMRVHPGRRNSVAISE